MADPGFDIRVGDTWVFYSNNGGIPRTIESIAIRLMMYRNAAGESRVCLISTFRRWWKGATLEFRQPHPTTEGGKG